MNGGQEPTKRELLRGDTGRSIITYIRITTYTRPPRAMCTVRQLSARGGRVQWVARHVKCVTAICDVAYCQIIMNTCLHIFLQNSCAQIHYVFIYGVSAVHHGD